MLSVSLTFLRKDENKILFEKKFHKTYWAERTRWSTHGLETQQINILLSKTSLKTIVTFRGSNTKVPFGRI